MVSLLALQVRRAVRFVPEQVTDLDTVPGVEGFVVSRTIVAVPMLHGGPVAARACPAICLVPSPALRVQPRAGFAESQADSAPQVAPPSFEYWVQTLVLHADID